MGYSRGDFKTRDGKEFHFELKDGPRIVLWDEKETTKLLDLDLNEAISASDHLRTLLMMVGE